MRRISKYDPRLWKNKFYSGSRASCTDCERPATGSPSAYEQWAVDHGLEDEWWMDQRLQVEDVRRAYGERCLSVSPAHISFYWTAIIPLRFTDFNKWGDHPARRALVKWNAKRMKWRIHSQAA